jgi:hypothetical protein
MAGERRLNWGADATDAKWRSEHDSTNSKFIVAEDLDGATILLEYDETASQWVFRGPIEMGANNLTTTGTVTAGTVSTEAIDTTTAAPRYSWGHLTSSLPTALNAPGSGVIDGDLYIAGGYDGNNRVDTLYRYAPGSDSWTSLSSLPTALNYPGSGVIDGDLYIAGGNVGGNKVDTLFAYGKTIGEGYQ